MHKRQECILGISPGTHALGIAVIDEGILAEHRVKGFTGKWSEGKLRKIVGVIKDTIMDYDITCISIKLHHAARSSANVDVIVQEVIIHATSLGIPVRTCDISKLKSKFGHAANRAGLAAALSARFPILVPDQEKLQKGSLHLGKLFEAIASAAY
jgi:hypothetical protein